MSTEPELEHHVIADLAARLAKAERALEEATEALRDLADAARNACDARLHQPLIEALSNADFIIAKSTTESRHD
jgi:hypothetical protein